jgi:hypothetical protein
VNNTILKNLAGALTLAIFLLGCSTCKTEFDPTLTYEVPERKIQALPTPFKPLSKDDLQSLWGKELYLGVKFGQEADYYRAITAFKSSLFLLPKSQTERKAQLEYYLALSYFFGLKYREALEIVENSSLLPLDPSFPSARELKILLWSSYKETCQDEKALLYTPDDPSLELSEAFFNADLATLNTYRDNPKVDNFLNAYYAEVLSPRKAKTLQALLPGLGYLYVGQKNTAFTSFVINALFIGATYQFFHKGYPAAALITLSLESGWYLGGINGAGLAANEFNERLYENLAKPAMIDNKLFPVLMFTYAF